MAVASYDVTRPAAAEGPANSSVPKQQRVGARQSMFRVGETERNFVLVVGSLSTVRTTKPWHEMCMDDWLPEPI